MSCYRPITLTFTFALQRASKSNPTFAALNRKKMLTQMWNELVGRFRSTDERLKFIAMPKTFSRSRREHFKNSLWECSHVYMTSH
jgi:hypothetical protein